ncbi:cuticle protein 10.9 [Trichonephila clavipes]|uniref:Cuticle protein 10.9 n=2 Tax=Trichonephila TaxID=2585208 RepID=A0A8X6FZJ4_TRICU|nr:cuticle protein 10.9 [Trichonephila clavata]GFX19256.1 cuticle protein 10.9 [Trichonephila clavipes]GFY57724.1 cuticle protein 10.9 [Trichonephila inaurata madagascariensis]
MIAKVLLVAALAAVSLAQHYGAPAPSYGAPAYGHEEKYPPQPYDFGYETNDDYGTTTFRKESGDGHGRVQGSYGYKDLHGIERVVEYVADEHGYRAEIKTNEPGTESQNPADVVLHANPIVVDEPKAYSAPRPHYQAPHYAAPAYPRY